MGSHCRSSDRKLDKSSSSKRRSKRKSDDSGDSSADSMGLTVKEIEELRDDIKMHLDMDKATPAHVEYWEALLGLCDWELAEARKKDALDRARVRGEEPPAELLAEERGLHSRIKTDARNLLKGKTYGELEAMQSLFESMMCSGTAKVVEYWEAVLKHLHVYKAKACLKEIRLKKVHEYLLWLEQRLDDEDKEEQEVKLDTNHSLQLKEEEEKDVKQDIEGTFRGRGDGVA